MTPRDLFRDRFTDDEWRLYKAGKCCWQTAYGMPWMAYCGKRSKRGHPFGYCREHAREMTEQGY
jgi:hypothetical protein